MADPETFASREEWIESNRRMGRALIEEINKIRQKLYHDITIGHALDRYFSELMIEAIEADDDPASLLRDTEKLKARYEELFKHHMRRIVKDASSLDGDGPFGVFRIIK